MKNTSEENWTEQMSKLKSLPFVKTVVREEAGTEEDTILRFQIGVKEEEYYGMLSELSGIPIKENTVDFPDQGTDELKRERI